MNDSSVLLSREQKDIIDFVNQDTACRTAMVQAFAGTGKTKLLLELAKDRFQRGYGSTLLLTYSAELKNYTRYLAKQQEGLTIESMHSLVRNVLWIGHECVTNEDMEAYLALAQKPAPHPAFLKEITMVCVDELQDMNLLYYLLFQQLRSFFTKPVAFVGVADFFQWLHGKVNKSSVEFMSKAEVYFPADTIQYFPLTRSYRLTPDMCSWINQHLNPLRLQIHYPSTWLKYGEAITKFWGSGLSSARCASCLQIHADCNVKMHHPQRVRYIEYDSFKDPLVPKATKDELLHGSAYLLLNGLHTDRFTRHFSNVTTPQKFKGCETNKVVVLSCDRFVEEVCASNAASESERVDWPFACYCQMYVSCTRAKEELDILHRKSKPAFFTMRADNFLLSEPLPHDTQVGTRRLNHLFHFVPRDTNLEASVSGSKSVFSLEGDRLPSAPNSAPGIVMHTVHHPFAHHYYAAIKLASYIYFTDLRRYKTEVSKNWTLFMKREILKEQAKSICHTWQADESWCEVAMKRAIALLEHTPIASNACVQIGQGYEYMRLTGNIDFVWPFGHILQVHFYDAYDFVNIRKSWLQAMAAFICWKRTHRHMCFVSCLVVNILDGTVYDISLSDHEDYFLGELIRRKNWHFLLNSTFNYKELIYRGAAVPLCKLEEENRLKEKERIEERFTKSQKRNVNLVEQKQPPF